MLREMYLANRKNIVACRPVVADMGKMSLDAEDKRRGCIVCSVVKNRTILDFSLSDVSTLDEWFTNCTGVRDWLRYWKKVKCVRASENDEVADDKSLLIFDFKETVLESFTIAYLGSCETKKLNKEINEEYLTERNDSSTQKRLISSHNGITARNQYLIIDKIAYLGSCETKKLNKEINEEYLTERNDSIMCTKPETYENFVWAIEKHQTESSQKKQDGKASKNTFVPRTNYSEWIALSSTTTSDSSSTDFTHLNYCEQLSCNFEENACNYLNHSLTKIPWMLRSNVYEMIISKSVDLLPFPPKDQFISTRLPSR
ncbi:hypothetical protein LOAG_17400 [Loa loa]|uniref:Uncharacterized protein n=1 Tax=Loa loa TaxID=7209 RepID=A0A1S0UJ21_LOALO|nr:hypothetical protein LOAG_17400 [Loa loa]EJD75451.1 hypothetical protein LOAG_17400 [Loa loa]